MDEFDTKYEIEFKKFNAVKKKFKKAFGSDSNSKSAELMSKFKEDFNELAKIFLKTNKKIEVMKTDNSYRGKIFVGGKCGISSKDYGGDGLEERDLFTFFLNLDKIDATLQPVLSQYYYDKWMTFISVFSGGVDQIIKQESDEINSIKRDVNEEIILYPDMVDSDKDEDEIEKLVHVQLRQIIVGMDGEGMTFKAMLAKGSVAPGDEESIEVQDLGDTKMFLFRNYLQAALDMEKEYREREGSFVEEAKAQFDSFTNKAVPYLSLKEL